MSGETHNALISYTWNPRNRLLSAGGSSGGSSGGEERAAGDARRASRVWHGL